MSNFADDPVAFFTAQKVSPHALSIKEQEALQLATLQLRFAEMRDAIAPLKALADVAKIDKIKKIEDAAALLFPHTIFKSYPRHLIESMRFPELTEWLSRLTLNDLSNVQGRHFEAIDRWMDALDGDTELLITTSSGTTDALSLLPRGKREREQFKKRTLTAWQEPGQTTPTRRMSVDAAVVWLSHARGRSGICRNAEMSRDMQAMAARPFLPLLPMAQSTDWQLHVTRVLAAEKRGQPSPSLNAYLQEKADEAREVQQSFDDRIRFVLEIIRDEFQSLPVALAGGLILIHRLSAEGLKMGMEPGLPAGSSVRSGGGLKGLPAPDEMERTIKRFTGVQTIDDTYAMSEMSDGFRLCNFGVFHVWPWIVPMVFSAEDGALAPRRGKQSGRAAFLDLTAQTYWGGVVSADRVTVSWDRCPCGRTTPHILPEISRIPPSPHDEHVLGGPTPKAVHAALDALNRGLD